MIMRGFFLKLIVVTIIAVLSTLVVKHGDGSCKMPECLKSSRWSVSNGLAGEEEKWICRDWKLTVAADMYSTLANSGAPSDMQEVDYTDYEVSCKEEGCTIPPFAPSTVPYFGGAIQGKQISKGTKEIETNCETDT
jgi:hypothetical protein